MQIGRNTVMFCFCSVSLSIEKGVILLLSIEQGVILSLIIEQGAIVSLSIE